jgi:hypothetical protein
MRMALFPTLVALVTANTVFSQTSMTGPFGFEKGMTAEQIISRFGKEAVIAQSHDTLHIRTAPKPHPDFDDYILLFSPKYGLVKVATYGKTVQTGDDGAELQAAFARTVAAITQKYGKPTITYDACTGNSTQCKNSEFWMMSLKQKNRMLHAFWTPSQSTNHVVNILVEATATGINSGKLHVSFELEGFKSYADELEAEKNKSF